MERGTSVSKKSENILLMFVIIVNVKGTTFCLEGESWESEGAGWVSEVRAQLLGDSCIPLGNHRSETLLSLLSFQQIKSFIKIYFHQTVKKDIVNTIIVRITATARLIEIY